MDAVTALRQHAPEVVICSWPPARNTFEREIFRTRSVQMYLVIASQPASLRQRQLGRL
jgi:hypothetical protein